MDAFSDPQAVARYVENPQRLVPGYADLQRMAGLLLAERAPNDAQVLVLGAGGLELTMEDHSESDFLKAFLGWSLIANVVLFSYLYLGVVPYTGGIGFRPCQPIALYPSRDVCINEGIVNLSECKAGFASLPERKRSSVAVEGLAFHLRPARRPPPSSIVVQDNFARLDDGSFIHLNETCNSRQMVVEGRAVAQLSRHRYLYANRGQR
jgi:tRNA (cmo5U34)-methyltransferase